jgi:glycosyltransferase involved in cell wall biosynthesis
MVILESAACGRATIGTAVGLLPDLGAAARVVPTNDADALSNAILSVVHDRSQLLEMGERARADIEAGYTLVQTVEERSALYAEVS